MANDGERGLGLSCVNTNIDEFIVKNNIMHTYPEESKARSRIPTNANDEKYVRGTSSAQGKIDGKSVLMTAGGAFETFGRRGAADSLSQIGPPVQVAILLFSF